MINVEVQEFKIKIKNKEYTFRLDFTALKKFDKKYGRDGMELFNKFLNGENLYECITKILSCSCVEEELTEEDMSKILPFNFRTMKFVDEVAYALVEGVLQDKGDSLEKN